MKRFTFLLAGFVVFGGAAGTFADTTIIDETFEGYADTTAMQTAWKTTDTGVSRIADNSVRPDAFPAGGKGAEHLGGAINRFGVLPGSADPPTFQISPSATQSIRLEADVFEDASTANKRVSFGIRNTTGAVTTNLLEMGSWNANTCDPTVSGCVPGTTGVGGPGFIAANGRGLAARMQLFASVQSPVLVNPNWQYYNLPTALDTSANGVVSVSEVGAAWNHYVAIITPTTVTLTLDLYRDGLTNDLKGGGTGVPGVDAQQVWNVTSNANGYNDIRFGGASGVLSAGGGLIFDNIKLSLVDVVAPGLSGDFNSDGKVDAGDYATWRKNEGPDAPLANDNAVGNQAARFSLWRANFGKPPGAGSGLSGGAVPEPASIVLLLSSLGFVFAGRRRTR